MNLWCRLFKHKWSDWYTVRCGGPNSVKQKICLRNNCSAIEQKVRPRRSAKRRLSFGSFSFLRHGFKETKRIRFYV